MTEVTPVYGWLTVVLGFVCVGLLAWIVSDMRAARHPADRPATSRTTGETVAYFAGCAIYAAAMLAAWHYGLERLVVAMLLLDAAETRYHIWKGRR
jgi:hypothetical protein